MDYYLLNISLLTLKQESGMDSYPDEGTIFWMCCHIPVYFSCCSCCHWSIIELTKAFLILLFVVVVAVPRRLLFVLLRVEVE